VFAWLFACRTLAKPYSKQSSADELKLTGIIGGLLLMLTAVLRPGMPQQLQECTAEVRAYPPAVACFVLLCHSVQQMTAFSCSAAQQRHGVTEYHASFK
jgi:hypothetical protein